MLKKSLSVSVIVLLLNLVGVIPAYAKSQDEAQARTQKVKEGIAKAGTREGARVHGKSVRQIGVRPATFAILNRCRSGNPDYSNPKIAKIAGLTPVSGFEY